MTRDYDLIVIGGGAGGLSAARATVAAGRRPLLIQSGPVGGDCAFTGCVPSKAVIAAAADGAGFRDALERAAHAVDEIAATETAAVLAQEGIDVVEGWARFESPEVVDVDGSRFRADRIVLATGTSPAVPPIEGLADVGYLTNETFFEMREAPRSLLVVGGGAVGCELAQATARLGVEVTLVEAMDRVLPAEEPEASEVTETALRSDGVEICTSVHATKVETTEAGHVRLHTSHGESIDAETLLVATGRRARTGNLNLESTGVRLDEGGFIDVDDHLRTGEAGIFAVGDVTGILPFTHAADEMGRIATANALARRPRKRFRTDSVPWVIFTDPEVGRVGIAESEAGATARVAELPMSEIDRGIITGRTEGFVKLISDRRRLTGDLGGGRLVGATIVAPVAGEMIHEPALIMRTDAFVGRLAQTVHAYPTWSVAVRRAAAQFFAEVGGRTARPARSR